MGQVLLLLGHHHHHHHHHAWQCGSVTVTFMNMAAQIRTTSQLPLVGGHH